MVKKKDLVIVALATFCLTATLLLTIPTRSQTPSGTYDPWIDINDDGTINILDAIVLSNHFLESGIPINKTALLLDLLARIDSLNATIIQQQNTINNLNNTIMELQNTTNYLNTTVDYLNQTVIVLNSTKGLGKPDYDSGWVPLTGYYILLGHNLNTTNIMVYMVGKAAGTDMPHQRALGGDITTLNNDHSYGAFWGCYDQNTIAVSQALRGYPDNWWATVRVLIWKIP